MADHLSRARTACRKLPNVLRVPAVALRFTPLPAQARPEDQHYLEALTSIQSVSGVKRRMLQGLADRNLPETAKNRSIP